MKVTYLSKLFSPTLKILPKDSPIISKSQKLLTYYGFISPSGFGTYTILPIFQRSLDKLINIINFNMTNINAEKLTMPSLGRSSIWKISGRWESFGSDMFRLTDRDKNNLCLQPTHEEEVTSLLKSFPLKYNQLPILYYQITPKFRNEESPKSGLLRCREFIMKDLYSFDRDLDSATVTYNQVLNQYHHLFKELGLNYLCVDADCGTMGGLLSHEFHVEAEVGEDNILQCDKCAKCYNEELKQTLGLNKNMSCPITECSGSLSVHKAIEIGHCFLLGDKYTKSFELEYKDNTGHSRSMMMGCYGIGVTRLLASCVEIMSTETQIRWPTKLAPYRVAVLLQKEGAYDEPSPDLKKTVIDGLREKFILNNMCPSDIIVDDSIVTIGKKLLIAGNIGIPWAIVVKNNEILETIDVYGKQTQFLSLNDAINVVSTNSVTKRTAVAVGV